MKRIMRSSQAILLLALLTGCGSKSVLPTSMTTGAVAVQAVARDAQAKILIARSQALLGSPAQLQAERIHLYGQLGRTDSDLAADYLLSQLARWETWPDATWSALEAPMLAALKELAADDKLGNMEEMPNPDGSTPEGKGGAKKHTRKFNIWDAIYKFFGAKRHHSWGGGGHGKPPAPKDAAPPSGGGGDPAGAPPAAGGAPPPAPAPAGG
jgi:hypothetical protein